MRKILLFTLLVSVINCLGQESIARLPIQLKKDCKIMPIPGGQNGDVHLFITYSSKVLCLKLDSSMQIVDSLSVERPDAKFSNIAGHSTDGNTINLFWTNSGNNDFYTTTFNFSGRNSTSKNLGLEFKNEKSFAQFSNNGKFYVLTAIKNSNNLKVYIYSADGSVENKTVNMDGLHFFNGKYKRSTFYESFVEGFSMVTIDNDSPTPLTESSHKQKLYLRGNHVVMTFDSNTDHTQVLKLDLTDFTASEKYIKKPFIIAENKLDLNSNSFLVDDVLYQIKISPSKFIFVVNQPNEEKPREFSVFGDAAITFKNSEIILENGASDNTKVIDKPSQFITKINNAMLGISGYKIDNSHLLTIGSVSTEQSNAVLYGAMLGGFTGALIAQGLSNSASNNFNSYKDRKVVYFNSIFDAQGNHKTGPVKPLAFDKMRAHSESLKRTSGETVFKINSDFVFCYYDEKDKSLVFQKFSE